MEKGINHRIFITAGCLLWILSFFGEATGFQPYSTVGIVLSPILTLYGLVYWFKYYKATRGHYPKFFKAWKELNNKTKKNPFAGMGFMFSHIFETWTFSIVFWMGLTLLMHLTFGQSGAFKAAKNYCESSSKIEETTGDISYYGVLVGGSISSNGKSGESDLTFTIIGEHGNFSANAELIKTDNYWEVIDLKIEKINTATNMLP